MSSLVLFICNAFIRTQYGYLHHRRLEAPRSDDRFRHVLTVRPRHLQQPYHQPDRAIRIRRILHHRLRHLQGVALEPTLQLEEPLPTTIRNSTDTQHLTGDLRGLHPARLHPPSTVRRHHRLAT